MGNRVASKSHWQKKGTGKNLKVTRSLRAVGTRLSKLAVAEAAGIEMQSKYARAWLRLWTVL